MTKTYLVGQLHGLNLDSICPSCRICAQEGQDSLHGSLGQGLLLLWPLDMVVQDVFEHLIWEKGQRVYDLSAWVNVKGTSSGELPQNGGQPMRNSYRQQPSAHLIKVYKTGAKGLRFFYLMIPKGFEIFSPVYSLTVALS